MSYNVKKLVDARERLGKDQSWLAYKCGVSYSTISRAENGSRENPKTLKKMATVLGVPWEEIVVPEADPKRKTA